MEQKSVVYDNASHAIACLVAATSAFTAILGPSPASAAPSLSTRYSFTGAPDGEAPVGVAFGPQSQLLGAASADGTLKEGLLF
jgi:hypothetical protein